MKKFFFEGLKPLDEIVQADERNHYFVVTDKSATVRRLKLSDSMKSRLK